MGHIEDTQPISVFAERVWAGPAWHYPHIEQMCKEMRELRAAVNVLAEYGGSFHGIGGPFKCWDSRRAINAFDAVLANPIAAAAVREAGNG